MRGPPIDQLVYEYMFPKPKTFDPQDFSALLQRSLIPEVRQETHAFYGHLDTQEAKYPGLDYTHPTHRIRLSRWQWHRRLFRAFDALGLTHAEISSLTKWEGTKWAKEKFEAEQGIVIRDTAADDLADWTEPVARPSTQPARTVRINTLAMPSLNDDDDMDVEESDEELASVGVPLNERLRAQAARREAGDTSVVLDEEWEQWLKNAIDSGELAVLTDRMTAEMLGQSHPSSSTASNPLPDGMLHRARAGQWSEIPEILQPLLRRTIDHENSIRSGQIVISATRSTLQPAPNYSPLSRRNYSNLRLPAGESSTTQPGARARGA
ncbi:hypothetical protein J3F83DRAFT_712116 [Trichoderma novae-zelandiae]